MKQRGFLGTQGLVNWEAGREKHWVISCGMASDFPAENLLSTCCSFQKHTVHYMAMNAAHISLDINMHRITLYCGMFSFRKLMGMLPQYHGYHLKASRSTFLILLSCFCVGQKWPYLVTKGNLYTAQMQILAKLSLSTDWTTGQSFIWMGMNGCVHVQNTSLINDFQKPRFRCTSLILFWISSNPQKLKCIHTVSKVYI